ncbi:MAG: HDIG domain-containing protein [Candidatus Bathyarchaeota archaeon]|nr:HDIG domain-containing protein [Candidatus Bathyarchaeota archaeon]
MSERLPTREQALQLLRENQCSSKVIKHCNAVAKLAVETAETCREKGIHVNLALVEIGALLHDIGRSKTHTVHHAVVGAKILDAAGLPEPVIAIVKRHVGGGITSTEAEKLGWPNDVYTPVTLEEKIVSYADKLIEKAKRVPIEKAVEELAKEGRHEAAERVLKLHGEIAALVGDCP